MISTFILMRDYSRHVDYGEVGSFILLLALFCFGLLATFWEETGRIRIGRRHKKRPKIITGVLESAAMRQLLPRLQNLLNDTKFVGTLLMLGLATVVCFFTVGLSIEVASALSLLVVVYILSEVFKRRS